MTVDELLEEIEHLQPPGDLPVAVDGDFDVEVSVAYEDSGDYLNIGKGGSGDERGSVELFGIGDCGAYEPGRGDLYCPAAGEGDGHEAGGLNG